MLADDEDLGMCNGSTMAGLGKREDRHTEEESRYYLIGAREVLRTGEDVSFELILPTC